MSQENVEIVRAAFEAWNAGDMDGARELFVTDLIMRLPEGWPEPGPFVGREAVFRQLEQMRETWDADELKPLSNSYRDWHKATLLMTPVDALDTMVLMGMKDERLKREAAATRELTDLIAGRLTQLPEMQRKVLALYYFEDLRLREIAEVFGVSESRICQIHTKAILSIRAWLQQMDPCLAA